MTGSIYDYFTAIVIVGALFVAAVVVIPNISYMNLLYVDQQQMRNVALETLKTMLFDKGYPSNWASSGNFKSDNVYRFGLASPNSPALYVLDPDKVERLVEGNPLGNLKYEEVRALLGLRGYGFNIKITPPFNVTVKDLSQSRDLKFNVTAKFDNEKPVPNAVVDAFIVYSFFEGGSSQDEKYSIRYAKVGGVPTNELGKCTVTYTIPASIDAKTSYRIVVFRTTLADMTTITTIFQSPIPNNIAEINMVSDEVILTHPKSDPNDARNLLNLVAFTEDGLINIYNGTGGSEDLLNYGSKDLWKKNFGGLKSTEPIFLVCNIRAVEKAAGRKGLLVIGPNPNFLGSRVLEFGGSLESGGLRASSVKLQRSVNVSGMTYTVKLTLWKES